MKKLFVLVVLMTAIGAHAVNASALTTEFQARVNGDDDILVALDGMGIDRSFCPVVNYKLYDNEAGVFKKNNITIRYRDKGKKADFCIKFKLEYDQKTLDVLSKYFASDTIKKEINRYYNFGEHAGESGYIELTFRSIISKKDIGLDKADPLSEGQIKDMFLDVVQQIKDNYPGGYTNETVLNSIKAKMDLFISTRIELPIIVKVFNRCRWEIKDWNGYESVDVEYSNTQYDEPFLEISTRVSGDDDSLTFFDKLKDLGVFNKGVQ